ncbi:MAG: histidine phosphatase family protein [Actinomycetota bacterium]
MAQETSELWLVRHAESAANAARIWQGRTDGPLSDVGRDQIAALGQRLRPVGFDLVLSSPLRRARVTAEGLGSPEIERDLIEIDLGFWEGMSQRELTAAHPSEVEALARGEPIRLGRRGETRLEVATRALGFVERTFNRLGPGRRALAITHGGLLEALIEHFVGRHQSGRRAVPVPDNTSISRLVRYAGRTRLASFNDAAHLGRRVRIIDFALGAGSSVLALHLPDRYGTPDVEGRQTGESWERFVQRIGQSLSAVDATPGHITDIATHGDVIRAYLSSWSGKGRLAASRLQTPGRRSVTHIIIGPEDPLLADFGTSRPVESLEAT